MLGHPVEFVTGCAIAERPEGPHLYMQIGHALWALLAALLGGTLARIFLARPADRPEGPEPDASATGRRPRKRWLRPAVIAWAGLVLATAAATIRSGPDAGTWAGATFFLTCGLLGLACLIAIFGRGRRRQAGVGAALFGIGYLFLAFARAPYQLLPPGQIVTVHSLYQPLPTSSLLDGLRRWAPAVAGGHDVVERAHPRGAGATGDDDVPRPHAPQGRAEVRHAGHGDPDLSRHPDLHRPHRPPGGRDDAIIEGVDRPPRRPAQDDAAHRPGAARARLPRPGRLPAGDESGGPGGTR